MTPIEFLDTNIIIRYLTQDNPDQTRRAYALLQQIEQGLLVVVTSEAVIAEVVYVLSSKVLYNFTRQDIRTYVTPIITLRNLKLPHKRTFLRALDLYASTKLDFEDVLNVAHMERIGITTILSFDRGFDKVPGITRREP